MRSNSIFSEITDQDKVNNLNCNFKLCPDLLICNLTEITKLLACIEQLFDENADRMRVSFFSKATRVHRITPDAFGVVF